MAVPFCCDSPYQTLIIKTQVYKSNTQVIMAGKGWETIKETAPGNKNLGIPHGIVNSQTHMTAHNSRHDSSFLRVSRYGVCQRVQWQNCFRDKRGCPYGQPKSSKDSYLVVRDDFWLSWITGQLLLLTITNPGIASYFVWQDLSQQKAMSFQCWPNICGAGPPLTAH